MIYSCWQPDRGGYTYWETAERRGIGDDLPVPRLAARSPIGVASTSIGRQPKGELRPAGRGELAKGCIMPLSRSGLSGGGDAPVIMGKVLAVAAIGLVLFVVYKASEDSLNLKKLF